MKHNSLYLVLAAILAAGCSEPADSVSPQSRVTHTQQTIPKETRFLSIVSDIAKSTQHDPDYHKISLTTKAEKEWFKNLMYRLWDREITRAQFIREGLKRYPSHRYEFTYIANAFQNY